jgi:glycogen phosphorylase
MNYFGLPSGRPGGQHPDEVCDGRLRQDAAKELICLMSKKPLTPNELTDLIAGLNRLARNLWWTWNQESQEIFQELSPRGWQNLYHNAVAVLYEVSDYELRVHLQEPESASRVRRVLGAFDAYLKDTST